MKKTIVILASIMLSGLGFYGCKKGENDPAISFHTRKGRLTGEWKISSGTSSSTSGGNTDTETWTETQVTQTSGGTTTIGTSAKYILTIEKDGTFKMEQGATWTFASTSVVTSYTSNGTWNWLGGVGDTKNKSNLILRTLSETNMSGSSTTINSYTGDSAPSSVLYIDQLKNKELIVKWDGTSTSSSSTSMDSGEYTFTKSK
jgi:hypothetical protein